ncbi:uncharacterized protein LOC132903662 [Amyelois transitella]|uniref:uncharacterized protein LOC132903662 n=1 Tax=Amyelois transitella TaxID=680683 RepID=UPI00298FB2D0|nr:uncharacterized protein LOC132903662 [Amyelois transitella]
MYKNPRTLKILQNVDHGVSEPILCRNIPNQIALPDIELSKIQPGSYTLQPDCSLLLEEEENSPSKVRICGTPTNIIICSDGSLRKRSTSSSTCSISILNDSLIMPTTSDIHCNILEQDVTMDSQETLTNETTLGLSEKYLTSSVPKSLNDDISVNDETIENYQDVSEKATCSSGSTLSHQHDFPEQIMTTTEKKRNKKSRPQDWSVNKNKDQREKGQPYLGKKKVDDKWRFVQIKNERKFKDRCNCKLSSRGNTKLQCKEIPEEERQKCFKDFWNMTWKEKKVFIKMLSVCKQKQRNRSAGTSSRRENSVELYLSDSKGNRYRVCKRMFLNSLSVGEWVIKKWIICDDGTPKNIPKNNVKAEPQKQLRRFFDSLPKLESHYCRKDSSKLYLEPLWTSKSQLYKAYTKDFCSQKNAEPLSIATFCNIFDELNLSLFRPKKDLCETCESFKTKNITESDYKIHQDMKKEARDELTKDTSSNNEVYTMDLQSVLLSPQSNVSSLYYKRKLIVHNFTLYDVKRNKGYCYIWNECEGKLSSNEFSTIIVTALGKFINQHPMSDGQELILYSDGCTYQNRNVVLANSLLNFSMQHKITVVQKFLEKGHTQMECDSMHSVIERAMRHKKINVPADYVYLAKTACKKSPYEVEYLYHHFFKNIENTLTFYKSIRPGKKSGDPVVTNLRALKYSEGKIVYKLRHSSIVWEELPIRIKKICIVPWNDIPPLYSARLQITKDKYMDLQELKSSMEKDYHKFYDDLPHF